MRRQAARNLHERSPGMARGSGFEEIPMSETADHRVPTTTTDAGVPAASDEFSLTAGPDGPILLQDHYLVQKMAQFNRERVPERVVHAKGGGAFGYFEATEGAGDWTR